MRQSPDSGGMSGAAGKDIPEEMNNYSPDTYQAEQEYHRHEPDSGYRFSRRLYRATYFAAEAFHEKSRLMTRRTASRQR